jgi:hypothetical protein
LTVAIPWTNHQAVPDLIQPELPFMVKPELLRPDADHTPAVEEDDAEHDYVEHDFGGELEVFLHEPEGEDADALCGDADDEEVSDGERAVGYDAVLERGDDGDGGVEGVGEDEEA